MKKILIPIVLCMFGTSVYADEPYCNIDVTQFKHNLTKIEYMENLDYCNEEDENGNIILDTQCCVSFKAMLDNKDMVCTLVSKPIKKFINKMNKKRKPQIYKDFKNTCKNNYPGVIDELTLWVLDNCKYDINSGPVYEAIMDNKEELMKQCIDNIPVLKDAQGPPKQKMEGC